VKVLMVNSMYPPKYKGGAEKAISLLAESMQKKGYQVVVVCLHKNNEESIDEVNGVKVYRFPIDNTYWPYYRKETVGAFKKLLWHIRDCWNQSAVKRFARVLEVERPDVIHTHNLSGLSVALWKEGYSRNIRIVHTMHDYYLLCVRSTLFSRGRACNRQCVQCSLLRLQHAQASQYVSHIVSVSSYVLNRHLEAGYFKGIPSSVIRNVNNTLKISGNISRCGNQNDLIFGFMGAIVPEKGIEYLLEMFTKLNDQGCLLHIAGGGSPAYIKQLQNAFDRPNIIWLGFISPQEFYSRVDVMVVPSLWHDPLPYVVLEAVDAGKPLICAKSGGIPEAAASAGKVIFYDAFSKEDLYNALKIASNNKDIWRTSYPRVSRTENEFDNDYVVDKYISCYSGKR
jgi:glycosyltransferase involved in cell wall biosynthesis